jgi:hypothetical protein
VTQSFRAFDLLIASAMKLPGAIPVADGRPDIEVIFGPAEVPFGALIDGAYAFAKDTIVFAPPGVARYRCHQGRIVEVAPAAGSAPDDVLVQLTANVMPALIWMRGDLVLHACCARLGASAIAVCGPSGSGKSTVLRAMLELGAASIADDALRIAASSNCGSGLPGLTMEVDQDQRIARPIGPRRTGASAPLAAIMVLDHPADAGPPAFERLRGGAVVEALLRNLHRIKVPRRLGIMPQVLRAIAGLSVLPVYAWRRARGETGLQAREVQFLQSITRV